MPPLERAATPPRRTFLGTLALGVAALLVPARFRRARRAGRARVPATRGPDPLIAAEPRAVPRASASSSPQSGSAT